MSINKINTRTLGSTDLQVSELGLGTAAMAGNHRPVPEEDHRGAIEEALDGGITFLDTAPFYGFCRSEHFAGDALRNRDGWTLSTKAGRLFSPGAAPEAEAVEWPGSFPFKQTYDYSYDGVMRSYEDSLQRLGLDHIDVLLLHDIGEMQHGAEVNAPLLKDAMTGGYKALDELRRNGNIKAIGLGVNEKEVCIECGHGNHIRWPVQFRYIGRWQYLELFGSTGACHRESKAYCRSMWIARCAASGCCTAISGSTSIGGNRYTRATIAFGST